MVASRVATVSFGTLTVFAAFMFNAMPGLSLFQMMQHMVSLVTMPIAVPLMLGLFYRKTQPWSGWSTVLVCLGSSLIVGNLTTVFGADAYERILGFVPALAKTEVPTVTFALGVVVNTVVGSLWFFGTSAWYQKQSAEYRAGVEAFFDKLNTPVNFATEHGAATDTAQLRTLGRLCLCYGAFVSLLVLIPNDAVGRGCFLFIGLAIGGVGANLLRAARRREARTDQ